MHYKKILMTLFTKTVETQHCDRSAAEALQTVHFGAQDPQGMKFHSVITLCQSSDNL